MGAVTAAAFRGNEASRIRHGGGQQRLYDVLVHHRVMPWWLGYFLLGPLRRLRQDPHALLSPYVTQGMTVLEPGPGMGFFTLELARLVGPHGRVVAIDIQPKMLAALRRRARRAGLEERIEARLATESGLGTDDLAGKVGFALAFAVVHELPDQTAFFVEVSRALVPDGRVLVAEPSRRVSEEDFKKTLEAAGAARLRVTERPAIPNSRTALLVRP